MYEICFTYLKSGASFIFELWEEFDNDQKFSVGNSVDACLLSGRVTLHGINGCSVRTAGG